MLKVEKRYDFKKELLQVHKSDRRDINLKPAYNEIEIKNGINIVLPKNYDNVILTAALDFEDYLRKSMKVSSMIVEERFDGSQFLSISLNKDIRDASGYMGYHITVNDEGVYLEGFDNVGVAQGLYFLEDLMNLRKAPFLKKKVSKSKALFSPRIVQSPFGMFEYSEECFSHIAHLGYDAIDVWIKDINLTKRGDYIDLPILCERAEKYGVKVYISLYKRHEVHPEAPEAEAYYDKMYGDIFRACPKICGIRVLAESSNFKCYEKHDGELYVDNIPTVDLTRGYGWPSSEYPKLMGVIQKVVQKIKPDADFILCSYNWSSGPEDKCIALIENLPKGISFQSVWDVNKRYTLGDCAENVADYSLRYAEPSEYFIREAKAAKCLGVRLYSTTNTAGKTWDFGCIPYEPMPYQWIKRYESVKEARDKWGLQGLLECIHYGFHPSFISELEKWAFFEHEESLEDILHALLKRDFGEENFELVDKAMQLWSEAICHYIPGNEEQYEAFRVGPAYPLWLSDPMWLPEAGRIPGTNHAMFGNGICHEKYTPSPKRVRSLPSVRMENELEEIKIMSELFNQGIAALEKINKPNKKLLQLIGVGRFMYYTCITGIHNKQLYILKQKLTVADTKEKANEIIDKIEELILDEKKNVENTIPVVEADSRLGWEPSMDYMGDAKCLRWKLRQLDYDLNCTLSLYRDSNSN